MFLLRKFFCVLFFLPTLVVALPIDAQKPMHIIADSSLINYKTGNNVYEGHVKVDQGSTHVTADRLTTQTDPHHKISEVIAYGTSRLAEYTTIPKQNDPVFHAKAKVIRFYPITSMVFLEGDAYVFQGENSFQGPIIIYNMKDQIVTAPASKSGHATILIEPKNLK